MKKLSVLLLGVVLSALLSGCSNAPFGQKDQISILEYEKCLEALNLTSSNEPYSPYLQDFEEKLGFSKARYELTLRLCSQYRPK